MRRMVGMVRSQGSSQRGWAKEKQARQLKRGFKMVEDKKILGSSSAPRRMRHTGDREDRVCIHSLFFLVQMIIDGCVFTI